jgi:hypothetical protein
MTKINRARRPVGLRGNVRRVLPLAAVVAATMLAGCVAYPYSGGQGYYQAHPDYHPYYAAQPANAGHWNGNAGW